MPEGGQITFISRVIEVAEASIEQRGLELAPGRYLSLAIADTGCGMDAATRDRLFEPFFTTKEPGKGTGLGLASVFGTLKNHHGAVRVASAPGEGSVFETLWPLEATDSAADVPAPEAARPAAAANLTVLVADDEPGVRDALVRILGRLGYRTLSCGDGVEAVQEYERSWREIDVVVLDVMMPRMSGAQTFEALRRINPQVRALLSSGYGLDDQPQQLLLLGQVGFLQKPYTTAVVSKALAEITARTST
jgi:two-component system cell cycle sensor histidine kinase/response regulator CckA